LKEIFARKGGAKFFQPVDRPFVTRAGLGRHARGKTNPSRDRKVNPQDGGSSPAVGGDGGMVNPVRGAIHPGGLGGRTGWRRPKANFRGDPFQPGHGSKLPTGVTGLGETEGGGPNALARNNSRAGDVDFGSSVEHGGPRREAGGGRPTPTGGGRPAIIRPFPPPTSKRRRYWRSASLGGGLLFSQNCAAGPGGGKTGRMGRREGVLPAGFA